MGEGKEANSPNISIFKNRFFWRGVGVATGLNRCK